MQTFRDKAGLEWTVEITVATNKVVKRLLKYSLYDLIDDGAKPLGKLLQDPEEIVNLLYVICKEQADSLSMSDEDFGRMFTGEVLEDATEALVAETVSFFPNRKARESLRRLIDKGKEFGQRLLDKADRQIAEIDLEKEVDSAWEKLSAGSGSSPASSASTPTPELSAN